METGSVEEAAAALGRGEIVCYPTETYYALGIDPWNESARRKLYEAKGRSVEKDLPVIASGLEMVRRDFDDRDHRIAKLAERYWPGPLTLVLPLRNGGNMAVRVSSNPVACELSRRFGKPVVSTSANRSGEPPVSEPQAIPAALVPFISILLDGGRTPGGAPSTIVSLLETPARMIRDGAISATEVMADL